MSDQVRKQNLKKAQDKLIERLGPEASSKVIAALHQAIDNPLSPLGKQFEQAKADRIFTIENAMLIEAMPAGASIRTRDEALKMLSQEQKREISERARIAAARQFDEIRDGKLIAALNKASTSEKLEIGAQEAVGLGTMLLSNPIGALTSLLFKLPLVGELIESTMHCVKTEGFKALFDGGIGRARTALRTQKSINGAASAIGGNNQQLTGEAADYLTNTIQTMPSQVQAPDPLAPPLPPAPKRGVDVASRVAMAKDGKSAMVDGVDFGLAPGTKVQIEGQPVQGQGGWKATAFTVLGADGKEVAKANVERPIKVSGGKLVIMPDDKKKAAEELQKAATLKSLQDMKAQGIDDPVAQAAAGVAMRAGAGNFFTGHAVGAVASQLYRNASFKAMKEQQAEQAIVTALGALPHFGGPQEAAKVPAIAKALAAHHEQFKHALEKEPSLLTGENKKARPILSATGRFANKNNEVHFTVTAPGNNYLPEEYVIRASIKNGNLVFDGIKGKNDQNFKEVSSSKQVPYSGTLHSGIGFNNALVPGLIPVMNQMLQQKVKDDGAVAFSVPQPGGANGLHIQDGQWLSIPAIPDLIGGLRGRA